MMTTPPDDHLFSSANLCYHNFMNIKDILAKISAMEGPLARQLLMTGLITRRLVEKGKPAPVLIGGLALSYYTREVYFTADIDLAYADREALDEVMRELGFVRKGRYWAHPGLDIAVEAPATGLAGEEAQRETVELEGDLFCDHRARGPDHRPDERVQTLEVRDGLRDDRTPDSPLWPGDRLGLPREKSGASGERHASRAARPQGQSDHMMRRPGIQNRRVPSRCCSSATGSAPEIPENVTTGPGEAPIAAGTGPREDRKAERGNYALMGRGNAGSASLPNRLPKASAAIALTEFGWHG